MDCCCAAPRYRGGVPGKRRVSTGSIGSPSEADTLLRDATKARMKLGWTPELSFETLLPSLQGDNAGPSTWECRLVGPAAAYHHLGSLQQDIEVEEHVLSPDVVNIKHDSPAVIGVVATSHLP